MACPRSLLRLAIAALLAPGLAAGQDDQPPATRPSTRPATRPATQSAGDVADAVLDRLLQTTHPTTGPANGAGRRDGETLSGDRFSGGLNNASAGGSASVAPDTPAQRLVREGIYVIDRLGTVRPSSDQRGLELVFAADGEQRAAAVDPPMLLLPNLNLLAVESAIAGNPDRRFRVTGRVTEYRGRNYLLLEKVVVE